MRPPWIKLCHPQDGQSSSERRFRRFRRNGEIFLCLPFETEAALQGLTLYPAQRPLARLLKKCLALGIVLRLPMPALTVKLNDMSPFIQFLKRSTGSSSIPDFAVLAGNPSAPGRRFVFLVLPRQGYPTVIKAGIGPEARQLIAREADVLRQKRVEMPKLIDFDPGEDSGVAALAMEHVSGRPPGERDSPASLLKGWLLDGDLVQLNRWCPGLPSSASAKPALFHGDFTPWNALITPDGFWKALDWERGQLTGPPAWDWFHYVLQPALLVNRLNADDLEGLLRVLLESPEFAGYAEIAGISKYLREVLLSYLDHSLEIARQTEGREQLNSLRHRIRTQWKSGSAF